MYIVLPYFFGFDVRQLREDLQRVVSKYHPDRQVMLAWSLGGIHAMHALGKIGSE